ncbi:TetR/AcrR family transcriptional regulator [Ruminococcus albus]|uniref:Transcriptional regulator, TetR family n=1 Tax=Ruminococcus albus 8 TaxID=246199 RepID=E9S8V7_RUMAL|nr:TetR/AcrR family transcriptional regulator [Ruminococcus albus]EGC04321.1 transcriptional regulator, TetR family [Ruminococcus albus 8]MCC3349679.1 TetR/AcrR family transcriptional regulator [Ruminococcus albus 8]
MPRDKTESRERIVAAAKEEFLNCGFENASMRRIAAGAGMTVSGLYKHFPSKEDMFAHLVQPILDSFYELYRRKEQEEHDAIAEIGAAAAFLNEDAVFAMEFVYDHFDEFKLLVCCSKGTRYEDYAHKLTEMEEESSLKHIEALRMRGDCVPDFDRREFHLLVSSNVEAVLQPIRHDFDREAALHYAKTINTFFSKGWKWLCGME